MRRRAACAVFLVIVLTLPCAGFAHEWTDASGAYKIQGDFVAVRADKVIIEKADGSIIAVALEKLSKADQDFARAQTTKETAAGADNSAEIPARPASVGTAEGQALAQRAQAILKENCYRCHGKEGASEGGFNFAQDLGKLARTLVKPGNPAGSTLLMRLTAGDDTRMPPEGESPRPAPSDISTIRSWIEAGCPAPPTSVARDFITNDQVMKWIAADVRKSGERSRRYLRYFTLTHLYNAGVSDDELQTFRNAFAKLINSLSWNADLLIPQTLDPERTVFRIDMRDLNWNVHMWEQVEEANPYFLPATTPEAMAAAEATQCRAPCVRVDWFVFAASKPPLYHVMLDLPETAAELESLLRINVAANIDQEQAIRAAFNRSGVSQNNRLIERHKSPYGSYYKSYDFGSNVGRQNLFDYPLGPGSADSQFQHNGGELIFTLPNGLQGYLLVNGDGQRIDRGPTNIISDPKSVDKAVINGVSCMSCHYTGMIPKTDEVGAAVRANRKAYPNADTILALYREPKELSDLLEADAQRFAKTMKKLGVGSLSRSGEPVSAMAHRFEQELDLKLAACEFGLSTDEFLKRLDGSDAMSRRFGSLRTPGGVIKRDVFASSFREAAIELKLARGSGDFFGAADRGPFGSGSARPTGEFVNSRPAENLGKEKPGEMCRFSDLNWGVKSLAFSPSGMFLAAGKPDRALRMFNLSTQAQIGARDKLDALQSLDCSVFTPGGARLLVGGRTGLVSVFEVSKDGQLRDAGQFAGHARGIRCMAVSGDGRIALSGGEEKKALVWEIETGKELGALPGFAGPIKACYLARDGRQGGVTDGATAVEFILTSSGRMDIKQRATLSRSWASGQSAAYSADGSMVVAGDGYNLRMWNLKTGKELPKMEAGEIQWSVGFTSDGSRLVSGGSDKFSVWDVHKQRRIHLQEVPESGYIQTLAISPDNLHVAAAGRSAVHVFRIPAAP